MVHCDDDENCPHGEWFHLSCLKLKKTYLVLRNGIAPNAVSS